jgi:type II secretory pathway component PulK
VASPEQLSRLISAILPPDREIDPQELVDALIDWRDPDDTPGELGAEQEFYQSLQVPYRCKNAPFETVEELLMVRGFDGRILYGEDFDRNGLLTPNEDDGDLTFPPDDGDGLLNRGLYPYITVYSREFNVSVDNKPRIYLFGDKEKIRPSLMEAFDDNEQIVAFILAAARSEGTQKIHTLADLLEPQIVENTMTASPITGSAATTLFDRCTLNPTEQPFQDGLINIVTAPPLVLRCIIGLPEEAIPLIMEKRPLLTPEQKCSTAWLVTDGVLNAQEYTTVDGQITGRSNHFSVEVIGYADHHGMFCRLQAVIEMNGPLAQVIYYRDLTKLGLGYPIRGEEGERDLVRETERSIDNRG